MRAFFLALLVVLACTASVSASSADWSAPEALWESDLSASELEARHSEFLMATDASSSTGPANFSSSSSSSSTGVAGVPVVVATKPVSIILACSLGNSTANSTSSDSTSSFNSSSNGNSTVERGCGFTQDSLVSAIGDAFGFPDTTNFPGEALIINLTSVALPSSSSSSSSTGATDSSSSGADASSSTGGAVAQVGRRLLAVDDGTQASFNFIGSSVDDGAHARNAYAALVESLSCVATETMTVAQCQDAAATKYGFPAGKLSQSAAFIQLSETVVPGTLTKDDAAVTAAQNGLSGDREVPTVGGPRKTNAGYYFLGALVILFIVIALVYFLVHKRPTTEIVKEEPRRDEVALAPVVAAPAAAGSGVVVAEEQPLAAGAQQQMDYRSVFALKHNVLDKSAEQKAAEEDEHNHNDVHFILHQ